MIKLSSPGQRLVLAILCLFIPSTLYLLSNSNSLQANIPTYITSPFHSSPPSDIRHILTFGSSYVAASFNSSASLPSPSNPVGNPAWPGKAWSGGMIAPTWLASRYNTTLTYVWNFSKGSSPVYDGYLRAGPKSKSVYNQIVDAIDLIQTKDGFNQLDGEKTMVLVWAGITEVGKGRVLSNWTETCTVLTDRYFDAMSLLARAGFKQFVFIAAPPLELTPRYQRWDDANRKSEADGVKLWNSQLHEKLARFKSDFPSTNPMIYDPEDVFRDAFAHPKTYGLSEKAPKCENRDGTTCLWHDDLHAGQLLHRLVAEGISEMSSWWRGGE